MNKHVSIINHTTVIPKGHANYRESFDTISLPNNCVYKITNITCKIDTTSLWNITKTNILKLTNNSDQELSMHIQPGYYTLAELTQSILCVDIVANRAYINNTYKTVDFTDAPDIANILRFEQKIYTPSSAGSVTPTAVDITNNKSVVKIYSSLVQQTFGITSSMIDNLIHVSVGLNNIVTQDNLDIQVVNQPNLDYIEWRITDAVDQPLPLTANVYINFTISVFEKSKNIL